MKAPGKPIKDGKRVIGYVSTTREGFFHHYKGYECLPDGTTRFVCGVNVPAHAIKIIRENDARRTLPKRPWKVRTANGSVLFVMASTEDEAHGVAKVRLRRWAEKALETANACVADDEELAEAKERAAMTGEHALCFGLLESSK